MDSSDSKWCLYSRHHLNCQKNGPCFLASRAAVELMGQPRRGESERVSTICVSRTIPGLDPIRAGRRWCRGCGKGARVGAFGNPLRGVSRGPAVSGGDATKGGVGCRLGVLPHLPAPRSSEGTGGVRAGHAAKAAWGPPWSPAPPPLRGCSRGAGGQEGMRRRWLDCCVGVVPPTPRSEVCRRGRRCLTLSSGSTQGPWQVG